MFKSLKLYRNQIIELESVVTQLDQLGYRRQNQTQEEGDFSLRGDVLDIFPATFEFPIRIDLDVESINAIRSFSTSDAKPILEHEAVIILPKKISSGLSKLHLDFKEEVPIDNFLDLAIGDYVVHVKHGIGRFLGMNKINTKDGPKDHLIVEYAGNDRLFVPVDSMHLVQKYISFERGRPKLYKLGSGEWLRVKNRARKGIFLYAAELLRMQAARESLSGFSFSPDTDWQKEYEKNFPYVETPDQAKATVMVKQDMESSQPMDRLLCGDVGYGKTEVAMRAAFKAVMDNKQVAILVPTTILAEQHYYNFSSRLKDFPINVEMLSRFKSHAEQKNIIKMLAAGLVDIVIGTHRLISNDIKFKDLGLVIIDEEQRFGVRAKEKLKNLRLLVDVLTLTATPIPRTLYMSLMGAKDMSVINTAPQNRLPIETYVAEYSDALVRQAILREHRRSGQVFFVHNRVQRIEKILKRLSRLLPSTIKIGLAHGQMDSRSLEKIMFSFLKGNLDVLVSTSIIESGIDVPNANTLIVDNAQDFGLADLHQLRGRVGRFNVKAFAYFLTLNISLLSTESQKRLEVIKKYSQLGAGFKIAFEDLGIRGAGNLLGVQQHGFISSVGFDLYCRLLRETISNLKGRHKSSAFRLERFL
ncbi:MAG: transcription-repair coupling factor [Candidatus Omnitrophota bacterium]